MPFTDETKIPLWKLSPLLVGNQNGFWPRQMHLLLLLQPTEAVLFSSQFSCTALLLLGRQGIFEILELFIFPLSDSTDNWAQPLIKVLHPDHALDR